MPTPVSLSLILCTYGRTTELERLFQSLAAQSYRDFEVIVVDQNPDARISPYLERARKSGIRLQHVRHDVPNLSAARNVGLQHAQGAWIGFPDDDCWYEPDMLERLGGAFMAAGCLSGVVARWAEWREPAGLPHRFTWARYRAFRDRLAVSFMLFFRRSLFDRIGGFDPRLGIGQWFGAAEETDFMMRALHAGAVLEFRPAAVVHHPLKEPGNTAADRRDARQRERGTGALYVKHGLPPLVIARGLAAPVLKPLLGREGLGNLLIGWMTALGRWEGLVQWRRQARRANAYAVGTIIKAPAHAADHARAVVHDAEPSGYAEALDSLHR
ncbi:MAG TPA: glycosyltransferase family A protein [Noviherbaspirillum sp.]|nr:glycosyltransferase family A protein [Noviherbaspirillum sp.]